MIWTAGLCTPTLSGTRATAVGAAVPFYETIPNFLLMWVTEPLFHLFFSFINFENEMYKCIILGTLIDW